MRTHHSGKNFFLVILRFLENFVGSMSFRYFLVNGQMYHVNILLICSIAIGQKAREKRDFQH